MTRLRVELPRPAARPHLRQHLQQSVDVGGARPTNDPDRAAIGARIGTLMGRLAIGRLNQEITQGLEARVEYWLPSYAIPIALAATVLTSGAASAMAARQVYKVSPIEALAPVGVSAADFVPRWLRMACGIAAVAVFAASIVVVVDQRGTLAFAAIFALFSAEIALGFALTALIVKATAATARTFGSVGRLAAATIERAPRAFAKRVVSRKTAFATFNASSLR